MSKKPPEETMNSILEFFMSIPFSRLIEIKREEQGNMKTDVWHKERSAHLEDGDYSPNRGRDNGQDKLYVIRRENRLHQKDIAKLLNINSVTYHRKETGKAEFTLTEAKLLANYFHVTLDELFGD